MKALVPINKYCEITSSKRIYASEYASSGVPFYRGKEISLKSFNDEIKDTIYISRERFNEIKSKFGAPKSGDLLMTAVGTIGNLYLVRGNEEFYFKDGNVLWFRNFDKLNSTWLYYWLSSSEGRSQLAKCTIGSSQSAYTIDNLSQLKIPDIDLDTQEKITSFISKYDQLIQGNERRIKILEEMAQRLYTEWFVKFEFPGHEKVRLVDSGTKFGKIPEGWGVKSIGDMLAKVKRKTKIPASEYLEDGEFPVVDQGNDFIAGFTNDETAIYEEELIVFGDHSRCFKFCNFKFACGADGTQLLLSNDLQKMPQKLFYLTVMNSGLQNFGYSRHFKFLKSLKVVVPDGVTAGKFSNLFNNAFDQVRQLQQQNATLAKMRDLLIPQLVSGKRELK